MSYDRYNYSRHSTSHARYGGMRTRRHGGVILGVCATVADFLSIDRTFVRLFALAFLVFFTLPTLVAYFLLALLADLL